MINDQSIHLNTPYRVRLKGTDDGGWKGNPAHIGTFAVHGTPEGEKVLALNLESVAPHGCKYVLKEVAFWPQTGAASKEIIFDVEDTNGSTRRFAFEIHREDHGKLISFIREGELRAQFEEMMKTPRETDYGPRSKAYAMALIRCAVQTPGVPVDIRPPTFLNTNRIMRHLVRDLLSITGLDEYSNMGTNAIVMHRPNGLEGDIAYGYTRVREPFLANAADFDFNMPIKGPLTSFQKVKNSKNDLPGYNEALKISKALEGTGSDAAEKALKAEF